MKKVIEFNDSHVQSIELMQKATNRDFGELIASALGLMQVCIAEIGKGNQICITKDGAPVRQIHGIVDEQQ